MRIRLHRSRTLFAGTALCALAFPAAALAANTYYVSPAGNDANDGRSQNTPWQTVAKVNGSALQPGDTVLFQRNGQWRESLDAPSSGAPGNPITFADYGSGAKPKFWGSVVLANGAFQALGGGIYAYSFDAPVYSVLANQTFFNYSSGQPAYNVAGSWSDLGGQILINSLASDPRSDGRVYTAVLRDDVVSSNGQSHLVFQNLITDESARYDDNGGYGFRVENSTDVQVHGCEAYHAGKHNFGVINSTAFVGSNLMAAFAAPGQQGSGGASAYVSYGDASTGMFNQTSEWHNITATNMDDPQDNTVYQSFVDHGATLGSLWIDNLQSTGASATISNADNTSGTLKMTGGLLQNTRLEVDGSGAVVDGVELSGPQATIDLVASNAVLQNLLVHGTNLGSAWYQTAILVRGTGNILRFSTVEMDPGSGTNSAVALLSSDVGLQMYGNALLAPQRALALWDFGLGSGSLAFTGYNFYLPGSMYAQYGSGVFQWVSLPMLQLGALRLDIGSKQGFPEFVNEAADDYRPAPGSPLIDAAPLNPATLASIPTDRAGDPRPQGAAYDIGAYETTPAGSSAPAPPTPPAPPTQPSAPTQPSPPAQAAPPPTPGAPVTLLSPANGQNVSGELTVTANITETLDSAGSEVWVDGAPLSDHRTTNPPYVYTLDTSQLSNGMHTLQIWAHNTANQNLLSNVITINVGN